MKLLLRLFSIFSFFLFGGANAIEQNQTLYDSISNQYSKKYIVNVLVSYSLGFELENIFFQNLILSRNPNINLTFSFIGMRDQDKNISEFAKEINILSQKYISTNHRINFEINPPLFVDNKIKNVPAIIVRDPKTNNVLYRRIGVSNVENVLNELEQSEGTPLIYPDSEKPTLATISPIDEQNAIDRMKFELSNAMNEELINTNIFEQIPMFEEYITAKKSKLHKISAIFKDDKGKKYNIVDYLYHKRKYVIFDATDSAELETIYTWVTNKKLPLDTSYISIAYYRDNSSTIKLMKEFVEKTGKKLWLANKLILTRFEITNTISIINVCNDGVNFCVQTIGSNDFEEYEFEAI